MEGNRRIMEDGERISDSSEIYGNGSEAVVSCYCDGVVHCNAFLFQVKRRVRGKVLISKLPVTT